MSKYDNESIRALKGADRVRKRPQVIFGSDGLEGCTHAVFEIVSNAIDEARAGYGRVINITKYKDGSVKVEDFGRGMPVDYNTVEERYNWELLFCELYAGGKYNKGEENYEYALGLNGLGLCATQYSSEWMHADIYRDGYHYHLDFEKGENIGGMVKTPFGGRRTGSVIHWKPDPEVFTDTNVPSDYYRDTLKRQAVVNKGIVINFTDETELVPETGKIRKDTWVYNEGLTGYIKELTNEENITAVREFTSEAMAKDKDDQEPYRVKMNCAFTFSNNIQTLEYYHNSSWLEYGGSPDQAVKTAFVSAVDAYLKNKGLYKSGEAKINFSDIQDCLVFVSSCFSSVASYENQTKKAINNKGITKVMTDFLKRNLETYFIEHPEEAGKIADQVLVNKRSREHAVKARDTVKKALSIQNTMATRVEKFVDCRCKDPKKRELYIVEGDSALGSVKLGRDAEYQAIMPIRGKR